MFFSTMYCKAVKVSKQYQFLVTFFLGISTGFSFALMLFIPTRYWSSDVRRKSSTYRKQENLWNESALNRQRIENAVDYEENVDRSVADELESKVRVLCWVAVEQRSVDKAFFVAKTWGKRCTLLMFMSSMEVRSKLVQTIKLHVPEGREYLWAKTKAAFKYVYDYHRDDADWFLKADDDTYVVMENLRYMLSGYDSNDPLYFGCRFKRYNKDYMSGGAGYVLSLAALELFVNKGLRQSMLCNPQIDGDEDWEMGVCLGNIGVKVMDSRDSLKRGRFFPLRPLEHLIPGHNDNTWFWNYSYYPHEKNPNCCSDYAITFHYIDPFRLHVYDYLLYRLRPYGVKYGTDDVITAKLNTGLDNVDKL